MSGLSGAMTTLIYPRHGRYDVDLHNRKEKVGDGCTTNIGNQISDKNNDENNKYDNNKSNRSDDDKSNHKHTSYVITNPGLSHKSGVVPKPVRPWMLNPRSTTLGEKNLVKPVLARSPNKGFKECRMHRLQGEP